MYKCSKFFLKYNNQEERFKNVFVKILLVSYKIKDRTNGDYLKSLKLYF